MWPESREPTAPGGSHRSPVCSGGEKSPLALAAGLAASAGPRQASQESEASGLGGVGAVADDPPGCRLLILGQITPHLGTHLGTHLAPGGEGPGGNWATVGPEAAEKPWSGWRGGAVGLVQRPRLSGE